MNKFAKGFLFAFAGLLSVVLLLWVGLHLYVESAGVQTRLEKTLSEELRMPVKFERVRLSLAGRLTVEGIVIQGKGKKGRFVDFLRAPEVSGKLALGPLLSGRFLVRDLAIISPAVEWKQNKRGQWELPTLDRDLGDEKKPKKERRKKEEGSTEGLPSPVEPVPSAPELVEAELPIQPPSDLPKTSDAGTRPAKKGLEFHLEAARIENASFRFLDKKGRPVAEFDGVSLDSPVANLEEAQGKAAIARLVLHDGLVIEKIATDVTYKGGELSLSNLKATLAEGAIEGAFKIQPEVEGAPIDLNVTVMGVKLGQLLSDLKVETGAEKTEGVLQGGLSLSGPSAEETKLTGEGRLELIKGRMVQNPFLQMIGQALQIRELSDLEMQTSYLQFRVAKGRVLVDDLVMESENLGLKATGEARFKGDLKLDAGLHVGPTVSRQFPEWIVKNFKPVEGTDRREVRFTVGGTVSKPEADLLRQVMGERLERQAIGLFDAFRAITNPSKKEEKKRKDQKKSKESREGHEEER